RPARRCGSAAGAWLSRPRTGLRTPACSWRGQLGPRGAASAEGWAGLLHWPRPGLGAPAEHRLACGSSASSVGPPLPGKMLRET
ncbi:unnamed protein product, partial [Gulo gulo]